MCEKEMDRTVLYVAEFTSVEIIFEAVCCLVMSVGTVSSLNSIKGFCDTIAKSPSKAAFVTVFFFHCIVPGWGGGRL